MDCKVGRFSPSPQIIYPINNEYRGAIVKRAICFLIPCMCVLLSFSGCVGEFNALINDAETRINIANILSSYELLLEHGYRITRDTDDAIHLVKSSPSEDGGYTHRIEINRRYLDVADADISFSISVSTTSIIRYEDPSTGRTYSQRRAGTTRRVFYTHRLIVESDPVVIWLLEDTTDRNSRNVFDELNLILDIVNLVSGQFDGN